jgi:hypothetical protein
MRALHSSLRTCPCFLWQNFISFSKNLALFSQNSVNTDLVENGATGDELDIRNLSFVVKFAAKFWKKMNNPIKDNTILKEIPSFGHTMFVEPASGIVAAAPVAVNKSAATSTALIGAKGKKHGNEPSKKKQKRETSDKGSKDGPIPHGKRHYRGHCPLQERGIEGRYLHGFLLSQQEVQLSPLALQERQALHHLEKHPRRGQGGAAYSHG